MDSSNHRIAKNTFYLYIRMIFVLVVSLYTSRVVLRTLGVMDYGVYNVVAGFVSMFSFLNTSLTGAVQRFYNFEGAKNGEAGIQKVYETSFYIQLLFSIAVLLVLETVGLWYIYKVMVIPPDRFGAAVLLFHLSVASLLVVMMQIPYSSAVMSFERMNYYAVVGIIDVLLKLVIVLVLPYISYDKLAVYALLVFLISVIDFFLYYIYSKNNFSSLKLKRNFDRPLFKSMLSFSGWNFFGTFTNVFYAQGISLLLNFFFGPVINAARGIANQVMSALHGFSVNIVAAFRPQLVESYAENNYDRTRFIMFSEAKCSYFMILYLAIPIIIEINYILGIWLGNDIVPEYATSFTVLVLVNMLVSSCNSPFTQVTHATGKMKHFHLITGLLTALNIPFSYIALKMGAEPTSVFTIAILMSIITQIACVLVVRHYFDFGVRNYVKSVILPCIIVTVLSPVLPLLIHCYFEESFFRLLGVVAISIASVTLLIYLLALDSKEKELVNSKTRQLLKMHRK